MRPQILVHNKKKEVIFLFFIPYLTFTYHSFSPFPKIKKYTN